MIPEMVQLIGTALCLILIGSAIYFFRYRNKEKPKIGMKRDNFSEYLKDYNEYKLYWGALSLIILGTITLLAIGIMHLAFM